MNRENILLDIDSLQLFFAEDMHEQIMSDNRNNMGTPYQLILMIVLTL